MRSFSCASAIGLSSRVLSPSLVAAVVSFSPYPGSKGGEREAATVVGSPRCYLKSKDYDALPDVLLLCCGGRRRARGDPRLDLDVCGSSQCAMGFAPRNSGRVPSETERLRRGQRELLGLLWHQLRVCNDYGHRRNARIVFDKIPRGLFFRLSHIKD